MTSLPDWEWLETVSSWRELFGHEFGSPQSTCRICGEPKPFGSIAGEKHLGWHRYVAGIAEQAARGDAYWRPIGGRSPF